MEKTPPEEFSLHVIMAVKHTKRLILLVSVTYLYFM